jgi:helicase MOV-10
MEVGLRFDPSFGRSTGAQRRYSVRFGFNRYPLRRQHQALHRPFNDDRVFFPVAIHIKNGVPNLAFRLYNQQIGTNPAQLLAVQTIVALPFGSHPFIVYGP